MALVKLTKGLGNALKTEAGKQKGTLAGLGMAQLYEGMYGGGEPLSEDSLLRMVSMGTLGRMSQSPALRKGLKNYLLKDKSIGPNLTKEVVSIPRLALTTAIPGAALTLPELRRTGNVSVRAGEEFLEEYEGDENGGKPFVPYIAGKVTEGVLDKIKNTVGQDTLDTAKDFGSEFFRGLGMTTALSGAGALLGLGAGSMLYKDDENLPPEERLKRKRNRSIAQLIASTIGGVAGGYGGSRLYQKMLDKEASEEKVAMGRIPAKVMAAILKGDKKALSEFGRRGAAVRNSMRRPAGSTLLEDLQRKYQQHKDLPSVKHVDSWVDKSASFYSEIPYI